MPTRRRILSLIAFDCALSGPFNKLLTAGSQHPGSLYVHVMFLLPPQRFWDDVHLMYQIIHRDTSLVKYQKTK